MINLANNKEDFTMMNTNATTPKTEKKFKTTNEVSTATKNIVLEGVKTLRAERFTKTFKVVRELHPKTNQPFKVVSKEQIDEKVEPLNFPLTEVTPEALADYRKKGVSSFVLKVDGKLYYTSIPDDISFVSSTILGAHQCAVAGHECHRLSAASDEEGGCEKVRNRSNNIERYPWITEGYETFNTKHDSFVVVNCLHYEKCPPRKTRTTAEINNARLSLAQFVWDDVKTLAEVRARKEKNKSNIGMY